MTWIAQRLKQYSRVRGPRGLWTIDPTCFALQDSEGKGQVVQSAGMNAHVTSRKYSGQRKRCEAIIRGHLTLWTCYQRRGLAKPSAALENIARRFPLPDSSFH